MENNNTSTTSNITALKERVGNVFDAAEKIISRMSEGNRTTIKKISEEIGSMLGLTPLKIVPYVNDFAHSTNLAYVSPGRFGGVVRGVRPLKTAPSAKTVKAIELNAETQENNPEE